MKKRLHEYFGPHNSPTARGVAFGQLALNLGLLIVGAWLAAAGVRVATILIILVPVAFVPFSYTRLRWHRFVEPHLPRRGLWVLGAAGVACDAIMALQILGARQPGESAILHAPGVIWIGAVWFSAHALLLLGYAGVTLARLGSKPLRRVLSKHRVATATVDLGRREWLQKAGLVGAALPFGVSLSGVPVSYDFRIAERDIALANWPETLDQLRIVHLSDIHVGGMMDRARLLRVAELTNQCRPDLVLHTGDFLTHRSGGFDAPLYEALSRIEAPYGQWACLGNHDFDNVSRFVKRLDDCGVTALRNRLVTLDIRGTTLEIGGLDFVFDRLHRPQLYAQTIAAWTARGPAPRILLNHDPSGFAQLPDACADLVLSGHTHGGHIGVQITPSRAITLVGLAGFPDQGLFHRADMSMYVTRCVGFYGYPMRIGIPPEVALLVLRSSATTPA